MATLHQHLMNEAYKVWQEHKEWSYEDFINYLKQNMRLHLKAVLVGNFNYQVENGGIFQWHGNGYSKFLPELQKCIVEFAKQYPELGQRMITILEKIKLLLEEYDEHNRYSQASSDEQLEVLDRWYCAPFFTENEALEIWLTKKQKYDENRNNGDDPNEIDEESFNEWYEQKIQEYYNDWWKDLEYRARKIDEEYYGIEQEFLESYENWLRNYLDFHLENENFDISVSVNL